MQEVSGASERAREEEVSRLRNDLEAVQKKQDEERVASEAKCVRLQEEQLLSEEQVVRLQEQIARLQSENKGLQQRIE